MNKPPQIARIGFATWLEWSVVAGTVLVAVAALCSTFIWKKPDYGNEPVYSQLAKRTEVLSHEPDPLRRDSICLPFSGFCRSIDAQIPTNARVFLAEMLGQENSGKLGYYYFLNYYLYPREVAISLGQPTAYLATGMAGRNPDSLNELAQAGYDLVLKQTPDGAWQSRLLKPIEAKPSGFNASPIPGGDTWIAFLLPLAVALAGTRLVRWLFRDLKGLLTTGELFASGLAVGMFLLTELILALRMAGARPEKTLAVLITIWAVAELVLLAKGCKARPPQFSVRYLWGLLLIPAGLMLWYLFRLAGLEGLIEFDAVGAWAFKSKLLYYTAGADLWKWTTNPAFTYGHLDYPPTVPLLYAFTYGALGHINEFVMKFWNQWMLLSLACAILGAGGFPNKRPWLLVSVVTIIVLAPITVWFARMEGGTIPLLFYIVLAAIQLALGLADKTPGRLRLGLFLMMGAAMVKQEGTILFGLFSVLLLLDKEARAVFWPLKRMGVAALVGSAAWVPYFVFRAHISVIHIDMLGLKQVLQHWDVILKFGPMTWVALLSRRLLNSHFATWSAPDNHHAVWNGKWTGLGSFADEATLGVGWVCLLALVAVWLRGQRLRWVALYFVGVLMGFTAAICIAFLSVSTADRMPVASEKAGGSPQIVNYSSALEVSEGMINGGRILHPLFMSWFVIGVILLNRGIPAQPLPATRGKDKRK